MQIPEWPFLKTYTFLVGKIKCSCPTANSWCWYSHLFSSSQDFSVHYISIQACPGLGPCPKCRTQGSNTHSPQKLFRPADISGFILESGSKWTQKETARTIAMITLQLYSEVHNIVWNKIMIVSVSIDIDHILYSC